MTLPYEHFPSSFAARPDLIWGVGEMTLTEDVSFRCCSRGVERDDACRACPPHRMLNRRKDLQLDASGTFVAYVHQLQSGQGVSCKGDRRMVIEK